MSYSFARADAARLPFNEQYFDMVIGSPPYLECRTYGIGAGRRCREWVEWMLGVTAEARRVCKGPVLWVVAGQTKDRNYQPAAEGLAWEWWKRGGDCQLYRPCYWFRSGIPGSGGKDWFRADVEYVLCFKGPGPLPYFDLAAVGHKPKWAPGGEMSHRRSDGIRVNQWGMTYGANDSPTSTSRGGDGNATGPDVLRKRSRKPSHIVHTKRSANGPLADQSYAPPVLANPGNLVRIPVGGNMLGSPLAHINEAPYPEALAEWFVRALCPPGGRILDPFSGSGTTVAAAHAWGRHGVGCDLRQNQCQLGRRRLEGTTPRLPIFV